MQENSAITNLLAVQFQMRRTGSVTASVWCDVYEWTAGGVINEGTGVLATSDARTFNSFVNSTPVLEDFTFSGVNRIDIAANDRRAFVIRTDAPVSTSTFPTVQYGTGQYSNGNIVIGGPTEAWGDANYPSHGDLPHLYEADDETIDVAPHESISIVDWPSFMENVWVEVHPPNMHTLIQEWVNDVGYLEGDPLSVIAQPTSDSDIGVQARNWDDMELVVEFRPRNVYVVT
jgi:hypothetical protein